MAKKIRFSLEMENGTEVRELDELKENFSLERVLYYIDNGRLFTWLRDRYHDDVAEQIQELIACHRLGEQPQPVQRRRDGTRRKHAVDRRLHRDRTVVEVKQHRHSVVIDQRIDRRENHKQRERKEMRLDPALSVQRIAEDGE